MYLETSYPWNTGDSARVATPLLRHNSGGKVCLTFAYDMHGRSIGYLNVLVQMVSRDNFTAEEGWHEGADFVSRHGLGVSLPNEDLK